MDFFEYYSSTVAIADIFGASMEWWVAMLVGALCFLLVYAFQAIGLFTIASKAGYKNKWMAFVPFFNTYYIGVCGQKNRFFNLDTKKVALAAAIFELVLFTGYVLDFVAEILINPYLEYVTSNIEVYGSVITRTEARLPADFAEIHPNLIWAAWSYNYLYNYILSWMELIYLFISIVILNCFFQTYYARHYLLFTITSVFFPIQGILIFAVRNNTGMSYAEYMRKLQERTYNMYRQQYYNQYNQNPYSGNYNRPPQDSPAPPPSRPSSSEDPFGGLGSNNRRDDDPFSDLKS